jgi:hypothetical protein
MSTHIYYAFFAGPGVRVGFGFVISCSAGTGKAQWLLIKDRVFYEERAEARS